MNETLSHVILTRFNLPSAGAEKVVRAKSGWLRDRTALFERYCLPSVAAQTDPAFAWIVYVDPQSPAWFFDWLDDVSPGRFHPVRREAVHRVDLLRDVVGVLGHEPDRLVTTNLDNDDAVSDDFVARLRAGGAATTGRAALYLENGLVRRGERVYAWRDPSNAFASVAEPFAGAVTCWVDWHNRLELQMPAVRLGGDAAWLQVIHGANVSNRVRGTLVDPRPYRARFVAGLDGTAAVARRRVVADRLVAAPARAARDHGRSLVKRGVLAVGGREAVDRVNALRRGVVRPREGG
ncbi:MULTISPECIES: glycosyltransferase [unclassified Isoptericola]|uniref:glycosyltransferase n=1 Tax=unclassified Isoptericola TaxID=2623355 RepID=UPI00364B0AF9